MTEQERVIQYSIDGVNWTVRSSENAFDDVVIFTGAIFYRFEDEPEKVFRIVEVEEND